MKITLENETIKAELSDLGATLDSLYDKKAQLEHAWPYDPAVWPRRTHICFPVCGKLLDSEYIHRGKLYSMPMHGFLREKSFAIDQQSKSSVTLLFNADRETLAIYPFDFSVIVQATLFDQELEIAYRVENHGKDNMPYSIGSHYNYIVPINRGETLKEYEIDFGSPQTAGRLEFSDGFIAGKSQDIFNGARSLRLGNLFSKGAIAIALADLSTELVALRGIKSGCFTEVGMSNFDHLLLWAPNDASPFVCLEAWAGLPDLIEHDKVLTNKKAIRILSSGSAHNYSQRIKIG
ncbi:MAG: hypothetical protein RBT72_07200 [Spirochaetia bacterium]|jgi:galactose mutarotase-like enzyme|nr:hypothetical protein [Spirochaetia bacterium]